METRGKIKAYREAGKIRLQWILRFALELILICGAVAWSMYRSVWAMIMFVPAFPFYYVWRARREDEKERERLRYEFKEMMTATAAALSAGYSMENALREARKDTASLLGDKAGIVRSLDMINRQISLNVPAEKVLSAYAGKTRIEDIESFAEVFSFAKRSGGDYAAIMRRTAQTLQDKIDTSRDVATVISQKRMESRIMDLVPVGIILYLSLTSPEFLAGLYGNLTGTVFMTACLVVYITAVLLGEKLADIRI